MSRRYIERILLARVYDVAIESPLETAPALSRRLKNNILLKREDLQKVFSFKLRGASNCIYQLCRQQRPTAVITASAGNHAQGVALAAQHFDLEALIVMPCTTPSIKIDAVRALGGTILLHGDDYEEALRQALHLAEERHLPFIHAYDDADVIAGQGTIGMEICRQHPQPLHAVFVPVGGGGLAAGVSCYIKTLRPDVRVIGVEPEDAASMYQALRQKKRVRLEQVGLFADGVAVREVGREPYRVCRHYLDEVVLVSVDEMCAAIKDIFEDTRALAEPSGALALAGLKKYVAKTGLEKQSLVAINSGANINFDRLRYVSECAEIGEYREALLAVTIAEKAGSFRHFCRQLGRRNITEFNYRYAHAEEAHIFVGVQLSEGVEEKEKIIALLGEQGYTVLDMTRNEMAKLHVRYMVGGRVPGLRNERLFRFEFPERPAALQRFLDQIGQRWNISMFHYRNHGAAFGRVLVGIQVPPDDRQSFQDFVNGLGYPFREESNNAAYRSFLS